MECKSLLAGCRDLMYSIYWGVKHFVLAKCDDDDLLLL